MNEYIRNIDFETYKLLTTNEINSFKSLIMESKGVITADVSSTKISVEYYSHLTNAESLLLNLNSKGFKLAPKKRMNLFSRFINKLAKNNKKTYGNKRLDCCDLSD